MQNTCCFLGHRQIADTPELRSQLLSAIEGLVTRHGVTTFLFGSKSQFNSVCHELVSICKEKYPHIKRVYVRAEFPYIDDNYKAYLLENYEVTYFPEKLLSAGKAVYIERNQEMIDRSCFCIVYYIEACAPSRRKSGTYQALEYALKQHKNVLLFPQQIL